MNAVAVRLAVGWVLSVGAVAGMDLVLFPRLGLFPWFPFSAVLWFGGFLGAVLLVVYGIGSMLGYTSGGGSNAGRQSRQSKGARER